MEGIGAIRIYWESTPAEDASSLKFIMVTTTMGHVRAQIYCGSKSYCNNLRQIKVELPEANASPDISEASTTAMMGLRLSPPSSTIKIFRYKAKVYFGKFQRASQRLQKLFGADKRFRFVRAVSCLL